MKATLPVGARSSMADHPSPAPPAPEPEQRDRVSRMLLGAILLVVLVIAVVVGAAFLPRWWAHRVGDQVSGSMVRGIVAGLVYGFVFTILPGVVLRWTFRKRRSWKLMAWLTGVAVVLASPNLVTLAIVVGGGNAAHAGERTLDVEAPGFRYATLAGALTAVGAWLWIEYLVGSRRRSRRRVEQLSARLDERVGDAPVPDDPAGPNEPV